MNNISLVVKLNDWIKAEKEVTLKQLEDFVKCKTDKNGKYYKLSTAERDLRPSKSPMIEGIRKNGAIVGYRWKQPTWEDLRKQAEELNRKRKMERLGL